MKSWRKLRRRNGEKQACMVKDEAGKDGPPLVRGESHRSRDVTDVPVQNHSLMMWTGQRRGLGYSCRLVRDDIYDP